MKQRTTNLWLLGLSGLCVVVLAWAFAASPLKHDDLFWHIRTGDWILEHMRIPHTDAFSFTMQGAVWITHEWLFAFLTASMHAWTGLHGLVVLKQLIVVCITLELYTTSRLTLLSARTQWLWPILCLVLLALQPFFVLRASLWTSWMLALLWALLLKDPQLRQKKTWWSLLTLFIVWGNLHAGVLFGFLVLGAHCTETVLSWMGYVPALSPFKEPVALSQVGRSFGWLGLAMGVSLLNPNGIHVWLYPFKLNRFFYNSGIDFDLGIFAAPTPSSHPFFYVYLALCLAALARIGKIKASVRWLEIFASIGFLILALRSNRFVFHFMIVSLPWCTRWLLADAHEESPTSEQTGRVQWLGIFACIVLAWLVVQPKLWESKPLAHFPKSAAQFVQKHKLKGRIFQEQNEGGFYGWYLQRDVFWDGRNLLFAPIVREVLKAKSFSQLVEKHTFSVLLLNRRLYKKMRTWLKRHHRTWKLVFWDDQSLVYVRNTTQNPFWINKNTYRWVRPFESASRLKTFAHAPQHSKLYEKELLRASQVTPKAQLPHYLLGLFWIHQKRYKHAVQRLQRASRLETNPFVERALRFAQQHENQK